MESETASFLARPPVIESETPAFLAPVPDVEKAPLESTGMEESVPRSQTPTFVKDSMPSEEDLTSAIRDVMSKVDMTVTSMKRIRLVLNERLACDLKPMMGSIRTQVDVILNEDDKSKLGIQVLQLKVLLKQGKHPELSKYRLGIQFCHLHKLRKNKEFLQRKGIWEDDITREVVMQEKEKAHLKMLEMAKKINFSFKQWLNPTKPPIAIQGSQPMLALENSAPTPDLQDAADETDTETDTETGPPPCPVHLTC